MGNAREALEFCGGHRPEMAMVDLHLSAEANGLAVLSRLRKTGVSFPVVMMSAYAEERQKLQAREAGAEFYLEKPFRLEQVRKMLMTLCPIK